MEQSGGLGHHSMHGLHMACLTFVYAQSIAWICIISWSYLNPNAPCILCMMRYKRTLLNGYYTKLPVITDTDCTSIARIWVMGFICIWHHDKARILAVSWPRTTTSAMHLPVQTATQPRACMVRLRTTPNKWRSICWHVWGAYVFICVHVSRRYSTDIRHILGIHAFIYSMVIYT